MLGYANITAQLRKRPDCATSARTKARIEAWAVAHLAGDVAERKFNGGCRFGGHSDLLHASDLLEYISTSVEQFDARLRVAYVGAQDLIEDNWPSVQAVAEELLRKRTLSSDEVASWCFRDCWPRDDLPLGTVFRHGHSSSDRFC